MASDDENFERFLAGSAAEPHATTREPHTRIPLSQRFVPLLVIIAVFWLLSPWFDELRFVATAQQPADLGDPDGWPADLVLPTQTYATVHGVLGHRAARIEGMRPGALRRGPIEVRQLLGAPVFIEYDPDVYPKWEPFMRVAVRGRLVEFSTTGDQAILHEYFAQQLGIEIPPHARLLILDDKPELMQRYYWAYFAGFVVIALASYRVYRGPRPRSLVMPLEDDEDQSTSSTTQDDNNSIAKNADHIGGQKQ